MIKRRMWAAAALSAAMFITPISAFAQQNPAPPDGTSVNEPPAAGPQAAQDACGNTPQEAFGNTNPAGLPTQMNDTNPKDVTGAQQLTNLSSVTGIVVHTAGNLVLVSIPRESANGMDTTTPATPDKTMAVIRLPDGCFPALSDGSQVKATGTPTMAGILDAEMVQTTD
jgi:hypothetical protein